MKKNKEEKYIWDLNIEPKLELLDEEMKHYINVCKEKLGMVPNVILANASDKDRLKNFVNFYNRLMLKEAHLSKLEREMIAVVVSLSLIHISEPTRPERIGCCGLWV